MLNLILYICNIVQSIGSHSGVACCNRRNHSAIAVSCDDIHRSTNLYQMETTANQTWILIEVHIALLYAVARLQKFFTSIEIIGIMSKFWKRLRNQVPYIPYFLSSQYPLEAACCQHLIDSSKRPVDFGTLDNLSDWQEFLFDQTASVDKPAEKPAIQRASIGGLAWPRLHAFTSKPL